LGLPNSPTKTVLNFLLPRFGGFYFAHNGVGIFTHNGNPRSLAQALSALLELIISSVSGWHSKVLTVRPNLWRFSAIGWWFGFLGTPYLLVGG